MVEINCIAGYCLRRPATIRANGREPRRIAVAHGPSEIVSFGHHYQGGDKMQCLGSTEKAIQRLPAIRESRYEFRWRGLPPDGCRVHLLIRQIDLSVADIFVCVIA